MMVHLFRCVNRENRPFHGDLNGAVPEISESPSQEHVSPVVNEPVIGTSRPLMPLPSRTSRRNETSRWEYTGYNIGLAPFITRSVVVWFFQLVARDQRTCSGQH